ncbi:hypothetical protein [Streptomyces sp. NPDC004284]|uniref:hypothetical protein n=1 Tax=Streptomyces sp. NPDC004284 TaxID=3364695 RepID=UPI00368EBDB0
MAKSLDAADIVVVRPAGILGTATDDRDNGVFDDGDNNDSGGWDRGTDDFD